MGGIFMKCRQILDALLKKNAIKLGVSAGLLFASTAFGQWYIPNGNFEEGEITAEGDTIPLEWGNRLQGDACKENGTCVYMDFEDMVEGEASTRIEGTEGGAVILVNGIQGLFPIEGKSIYIKGKYKAEVPVGQSISMGIAAVPFCGGGGYKQLSYQQIARVRGATDGWTEFEHIMDVHESQMCADEYGYNKAHISIHIYHNGGGTSWFDDFIMDTIGGTGITNVSHQIRNIGSSVNNIRFIDRTVQFDQATSYTITIARPNGQIYAIRKGTGTSAALFTNSLAAGTYIVNVSSELGNISRAVIIDQ